MCGDNEPADESWLDLGERELDEFKKKETNIIDIVLSRLQELKKMELREVIPIISITIFLEIKAEIVEATQQSLTPLMKQLICLSFNFIAITLSNVVTAYVKCVEREIIIKICLKIYRISFKLIVPEPTH